MAQLQTQHASFDDIVKVHPFRRLIAGLIEEIVDEDFRMLIALSKEKLGPEYESIERNIDHQRFFDVLEKRLGEDNTTEYLINLFEDRNLWSDIDKYADRITRYKKEKEDYIKQCMEKGVSHDPNFIGREILIHKALECFKEDSQYKGVILCGLGGMGKTTMASEICFNLKYKYAGLTFHTVDLRERSSCKDVYQGLLMCLVPDVSLSLDQDPLQLRVQLLETVKTKFMMRTVVFLDNADGIVTDQYQFFEFHRFLSDLLDIMVRMGTDCKTKILVTMRQKFCRPEDMPRKVDDRLNGRMKEFELSELSEQESVLLLQKCSGLDSDVLSDGSCITISKRCGGSPMALRIIADMLRDGHSVQDIMLSLKNEESAIVGKLKIDSCLEKAFLTVDKFLQELLVKLSLFQTAKFDLQAAMTVGMDEKETEDMLSFGKQWKKKARDVQKAKMRLKLLQLKQRHLVEFVEFPEERGQAGKEISRFSLHPLVWKYLRETSKETELQLKVDEAKKRFLVHFIEVINDCGKEAEVHPLKVARLIEDNIVHLKQFFNFFINDIYSLNDFVKGERKEKVMVQNGRIKNISELVLNTELQKLFYRRQAERMKKAGQMYRYIYWRCQEAENLLSQDRLELAEQILDKLEEEAGIVQPSGSTDSQQAAVVFGGQFEPQSSTREMEEDAGEPIPSIAAYHKAKAGCFTDKKMYDRALEHLKVAECLYSGRQITGLVKTRRDDGSKNFRKSDYRGQLADVKNSIGAVYFDKRELRMAELYHQDAYDTVCKIGSKPFHIDMPTYVTNIGSCHHQIGINSKDESERTNQLEKARRMYDQSINYKKIMNKDMDMTYVNTLRNRANVLYLLGEVEQALQDARVSLSIRKRMVIPPNVELTEAIIQVASFYYKVGKKKRENKDMVSANEHFKEALKHFDNAQIHVKNGGMPIEHNEYKDYRNLRAEHMRLLKKDLKMPRHDIERVKKIYRDFEDGKYSRKIQQNKLQDTDVDFEELLRQARAEGQMFEAEDMPFSDGSSDESSSSGSWRSHASESSSSDEEGAAPRWEKKHRRDSGIEDAAVEESLEYESEDVEGMEVGEGRIESTGKKEGKRQVGDKRSLAEKRQRFAKTSQSSMEEKSLEDTPCPVVVDRKESAVSEPKPSSSQSSSGKLSNTSSRSAGSSQGSRKRSSLSLQSVGSQDSVTSLMGKLMTLHSRSFDEDVFIPQSALEDEEEEEFKAPETKKPKKDP